MIKEENIFLDLDFKNKEELFSYMNNIYLERGYVTKEYYNALSEREKVYPTGITFGNYSIAIPHTDIKYILEENIVFIRLKNEIEFGEMTSGDTIKTKVIIMLLVKEADHQTDYLVQLMGILSEEENYKLLSTHNDIKEIKKIF